MPSRRNILSAGLLIIAGLSSYGVGAAATQLNTPPTPPWVRADGTLDRSKLPECIVVLGNDGAPIKNGEGEEVCMPSQELFAPPVASPEQPEPRSAKILRQYQDEDGHDVIVVESKAWPFR